MKLLLTCLLVCLMSFANGQAYLKLKGKSYSLVKDLTELKGCVKIDAKVNSDRYLCRMYLDTLVNKVFIWIEKETTIGDTNYSYHIVDLKVLPSIQRGNYYFIGSDEDTSSKSYDNFIIAIECCNTGKYFPPAESSILKAWAFNQSKNKIETIEVKGLTRINEGYYRNIKKTEDSYIMGGFPDFHENESE